jgi:V-type H+-transporting ATPase proteolipid subunit
LQVFLNQQFETDVSGVHCPVYAAFFGSFGAAMALVFSSLGAAYGIAKSTEGITKMV